MLRSGEILEDRDKTRLLIIDDEALARKRIHSLIAGDEQFEILGECCNGLEAVEEITRWKPDLVFLDIQMPELDGFGVLRYLADQRLSFPVIVFVTAYDEYAIQAFEYQAIDYLLKPFSKDRFFESLSRASDQIHCMQNHNLDKRISSLLRSTEGSEQQLRRILIKEKDRVSIVLTSDIVWIEAEGLYVNLHVGEKSHLLRETMHNLDKRLDPKQFVRIHCSAIVNIEHILELQPMFKGDYQVVLKGGTRCAMSRGYRKKVFALLENTSPSQEK